VKEIKDTYNIAVANIACVAGVNEEGEWEREPGRAYRPPFFSRALASFHLPHLRLLRRLQKFTESYQMNTQCGYYSDLLPV